MEPEWFKPGWFKRGMDNNAIADAIAGEILFALTKYDIEIAQRIAVKVAVSSMSPAFRLLYESKSSTETRS